MTEERKSVKLPHQLILEERGHLELSGVTEVERAEEQTVVVATSKGRLLLKGNGLHINQFCTETGAFSLEGQIDSMQYLEAQAVGKGFFSKLFR